MNKSKLSVLGWFVLLNAMLASLIAARFFAFFPTESFTPLSALFAVLSTLGQMSLLVALFALVLWPLLFLPERARRVSMAIIAALGISVLFIDTIVFAQYRFHINSVVVGLILAGDIVSFPLVTWLMALGGFVATLLIEYTALAYLEKRQQHIPAKLGRKLGWTLVSVFVLANLIHAWAVANAYQPVSMVKRYLPLYYPLTANSLMKKLGWVDLDAIEQEKSLKLSNKGDLNYPLNPLQTMPLTRPKDIMLLVIDSWRYDTFSQAVSPTIWQLAQQGVTYQNHISTGNATRTGIFGLFYGMPGTYWHAFLANQRSPVLIDRLQQLNYQMGIFTSAQLIKPEFNRTVFRNVPDLRIRSEGDSPSAKDRNLTDDWKNWYQNVDHAKPAFSFLFYDAPHGYDFPATYPHKFEPMLDELNYLALNNETDPTPLFNRYKTSVHYVDSLVKEVVDTLKAQDKLDDTVIIITGDHGQELNDNKLNFWGHNSNFTDPQVKVPFIIVAPDVKKLANAQYLNALSSHEDVVPTLMVNYLGVANPLTDYSTGEDLFGPFKQRGWIMSSKYSGYGIITPDSILEVNTAGGYESLDKRNRPTDRPLNSEQLTGALEHISRYLK
ncbi:DUF3413 domain-containing protein [Vibrio proteolyticus]